MSIGRGRAYGELVNQELNPATVAGAHATGRDGFSGMVRPGSAFTNPDAGISQDIGHHEVLGSPQGGSDLAPIPGVVSRPLFGGVRTSPAYETLRDGVAFDGSHVTLANRHRSVVVLDPVEEMLAAPADQFPSLRVPPVSDPLGRVCANAQAGGPR